MNTDAAALIEKLDGLADPRQAAILQRFFKTAPGQYGYGDVFLGIKVPVQRKIAKKYQHLSLPAISHLLKSRIHEHRLTALLILNMQYQKADSPNRETIFRFYMKHKKAVNNWDLVDLSAPAIAGDYLLDKDRTILYELAQSKNLWDRRIAILSTFQFIRHKQTKDTYNLARTLLNDPESLIHKAVGWMLREAGKRIDTPELTTFLDRFAASMPRTMLRYAIERLPEKQRKAYLSQQ